MKRLLLCGLFPLCQVKKEGDTYKPGFVQSLNSVLIIYLCDLPPGTGRAILRRGVKKKETLPTPPVYMVLQPARFAKPIAITHNIGELLPHLFTFAATCIAVVLVSAALSVNKKSPFSCPCFSQGAVPNAARTFLLESFHPSDEPVSPSSLQK